MNAFMQLECRFENRTEMTYLLLAMEHTVSVGEFVLLEVHLVAIRVCFQCGTMFQYFWNI